jgi:hypothetical protein
MLQKGQGIANFIRELHRVETQELRPLWNLRASAVLADGSPSFDEDRPDQVLEVSVGGEAGESCLDSKELFAACRCGVVRLVPDVVLVTFELGDVIGAIVPSCGVVNLVIIDGLEQQGNVE